MKTTLRNRIFVSALLSSTMLAGCVAGEQESSDPANSGGNNPSNEATYYAADDADAIQDQYIVVFREGVPESVRKDTKDRVWARTSENSMRYSLDVIPGFACTMDRDTFDELRSDPNVAYIEQDREIRISKVQANARPGLDRIDQRSASLNGSYDDRGRNGSGVHVYVVDTGLRSDHVEFTGRVRAGATAINDGRGTEDCNGHGTHVASSALGTLTGVAKQALIHPLRAMDCNGSGATSGIISALNFVATQGERPAVVNMSLGGGASQALDNAVNNLIASGVTVVVAAGNENQSACNVSPARTPNAITVGSVSNADRRSSFSNFGTCVDLFAPGEGVFGAGINAGNAAAVLSGTSMASPHVAGVAALVLQANRNATPAQVASTILNASTPNVVVDTRQSPNRVLFNGF